MNIQIFGKNKCFDTKKAERYFKEHAIKFQSIDVARFGMSEGEYRNIKSAVGGASVLFDEKSKEFASLNVAYLAYENDKEIALMENPGMFKTPIVRNGKKATIGFCPEIWKDWE